MRPYLSLKAIRTPFVSLDALEIERGELLVLVGPSGAGKTTLLNIIAGFCPHQGTIELDQQQIQSTPVNRRQVGYLFQDLCLFPHLTVSQNLSIAMRGQKMAAADQRQELQRLLALFRIEPLADRYPGQLSGGEKQRAAMARSIAAKPKLLLLDEPFSHLDYKTARYLRREFVHLQRRLEITTIFVTHDLQEARELGDRIAVMEEGRIRQLGTPAELFYGAGDTACRFLEKPNILEGFIDRSLDNGLVEFRWQEESLLVADDGSDFSQVAIWPEDVHILPQRPQGSAINCIQARLKAFTVEDHRSKVQVQVGQSLLNIVVETEPFLALGLRVNDPVYIILRLWCLRGLSADRQPASRGARQPTAAKRGE